MLTVEVLWEVLDQEDLNGPLIVVILRIPANAECSRVNRVVVVLRAIWVVEPCLGYVDTRNESSGNLLVFVRHLYVGSGHPELLGTSFEAVDHFAFDALLKRHNLVPVVEFRQSVGDALVRVVYILLALLELKVTSLDLKSLAQPVQVYQREILIRLLVVREDLADLLWNNQDEIVVFHGRLT